MGLLNRETQELYCVCIFHFSNCILLIFFSGLGGETAGVLVKFC